MAWQQQACACSMPLMGDLSNHLLRATQTWSEQLLALYRYVARAQGSPPLDLLLDWLAPASLPDSGLDAGAAAGFAAGAGLSASACNGVEHQDAAASVHPG